MPVVRRGDHHCVDVLSCDEFTEVAGPCLGLESGSIQAFRAMIRIHVADTKDFDTLVLEERGEVAATHAADTDAAQLNALVGWGGPILAEDRSRDNERAR